MGLKKNRMILQINKDEYEINNTDELWVYLDAAKQKDYLEIWLLNNNKSICLLSNKNKAWLMYLQYEGDTGFSSRNLNYIGSADTTLEFYLSNGQKDYYPEQWTISIEKAFQALEYFYLYANKTSFINWHNNSIN